MKRPVVVNDRMQQGYVYWLTEPEGQNVDSQFHPELTPRQMLKLGVFGGRADEVPAEWFAKAKLSARRYPELNCYGVDASRPEY